MSRSSGCGTASVEKKKALFHIKKKTGEQVLIQKVPWSRVPIETCVMGMEQHKQLKADLQQCVRKEKDETKAAEKRQLVHALLSSNFHCVRQNARGPLSGSTT
jgi:hypothetical protein